MKWFVVENDQWKSLLKAHIPILQKGWGNGYVAVPPGHVLYKKDYSSVFYLLEDTEYEINIHGGLTYSNFGDGEDAPENWWVFGFDTSHFDDNLEKWPKERVIEETKELFWQLLEIEWGEL